MRRSLLLVLALLILAVASQATAASANFQANCSDTSPNVFCAFDATRYYFVYPPTSCAPATIVYYFWDFGVDPDTGEDYGSYGDSSPYAACTYPNTAQDLDIRLTVYCSDGSNATIVHSYNPPWGFRGAIYPGCGWNPECPNPS